VKAQKKRFKSLDSLLTKHFEAGKFHGNLLVAEKGKVVYQTSLGKANEETGEKLTENSVFELASVSKQFTAMGIAILQEQGKLAYHDKVQKYIPTFPYPDITVLHLVHHTSGLADYMELLEEHWLPQNENKIATNQDIVTLFADKKPPLRFLAGEKYEYSNTGYALLAVIIENVSGMDFGTFLDKHIFKPLDMKQTLVYRRRYKPQEVKNYALGYVIPEKTEKATLPDNTKDFKMAVWLDGIVGDGTINSTIGDMLKWDRALYTEKIVKKGTIDFIHTSGKLNNGKETGYGFGVMITTHKTMGKIVAHSGGWIGYVTYFERHIDNDKTIIILQNREFGLPKLRQIHKHLYNLPAEPKTTENKEVAIAEDILKKYVGEYEVEESFTFKVTLEAGKLFVQATGQEKLPIFAKTETRFFLKVVKAEIEFFENRLILYQGGQEIEATKK
jgi:CubicO group peptidase (beta-lactamase class C family)